MSNINIRKGHRSHASKTIKKIEDKLKSDVVNLNELGGLRQSLKEKLVVLKDLDGKILSELTEEDAITDEIENSSDFAVDIQTAIFSVDQKLAAKPVKKNESFSSFVGDTSIAKRDVVRLPKIEIKPFHGNPIEFQSFWDSFEATIHLNDSLEDVTKFSYLKGSSY